MSERGLSLARGSLASRLTKHRGAQLLLLVLRRVIVMVCLLTIISFAVFSLLYISPGNAVDILQGSNPSTPQTRQLLRDKYHLDEPFLTQYAIWAAQAIRLRFGDSVETTLPVSSEIKARLPVTLFLGIYAWLLTMIGGIGLGVWSGLRRGRAVDRAIVATSVIALSTPVFVSGVFLLYVLAVLLHWFPTFGAGSGFLDRGWHLTLPALALAAHSAAYVIKHTRAATIAAAAQDHVTFARARGLSRSRVLLRYVLRNALVPVVTIGGIVLSTMIVGAVLAEVTFSLPGIGSLLVEATTNKDLPLLQGVAMLIALVIIVANLLTDLVYLAIDPRIRIGRART